MRKSRVRETKRDEIFTRHRGFRLNARGLLDGAGERWGGARFRPVARRGWLGDHPHKALRDALCGFVAAAPAPAPGEKSAVGQKILLDLRREGDRWRGPIFNLDDQKTYDGEISMGVDGSRLKVRGCVPGGGVCGGETWKREPEASPR